MVLQAGLYDTHVLGFLQDVFNVSLKCPSLILLLLWDTTWKVETFCTSYAQATGLENIHVLCVLS